MTREFFSSGIRDISTLSRYQFVSLFIERLPSPSRRLFLTRARIRHRALMKRSRAPQQPRPRRFSLLVFRCRFASLVFWSYLFRLCHSLHLFIYFFPYSSTTTSQKKEKSISTGKGAGRGKARAGRTCDGLGVLDRGGNRRRVRSSNIRLDGCVDGVASERRNDCCWR